MTQTCNGTKASSNASGQNKKADRKIHLSGKHLIFPFALILQLFATAYSLNAQPPKKLLFVLSAADKLPLKNGKQYSTGVFLSEFYTAFSAFRKAGYVIDIATPNAKVATIDPVSTTKKFWKNKDTLLRQALSFIDSNKTFNHPISLQTALANAADYEGIIIPGGQGLMADLVHDSLVTALLLTFKAQDKPIGLICHAPAILLSIPDGQNPFMGYKVNAVSTMEEFFIERFIMKGKPHNRKISKQLKAAGYVYEKGRAGKTYAINDRKLITCQNPSSGEQFTKLYLNEMQSANTSAKK